MRTDLPLSKSTGGTNYWMPQESKATSPFKTLLNGLDTATYTSNSASKDAKWSTSPMASTKVAKT